MPLYNPTAPDTVNLKTERAMAPSTFIAESRSRIRLGTTSTPTSGTLYLVPIHLAAGTVISNISYASNTGITSPTNWWFILLDSSFVGVAVTADQTNTAWGNNTTKTVAIAATQAGAASTFTTTYTGIHYTGIVYVGSALTLASEGSLTSALGGVTPMFGNSNTGQTTPPVITAGAFTATTPSGGIQQHYSYLT